MTHPAICYCDHPFEDHLDGAERCRWCDCNGYAERTEVETTADVLAYDDWESNRYSDTDATALELVRLRRLRLISGGAA